METKERPILFGGAMVRATLDDRKTMTRRVVKPQPDRAMVAPHCENGWWMWRVWTPEHAKHGYPSTRHGDCRCPYGVPGDRLWVREAWGEFRCTPGVPVYRADDPVALGASNPWRPSIHMPRAFSRLTLEVTGVRVERLQDISEEDARAEGLSWVAPTYGVHGLAASWHGDPRESFRTLWNSINLAPSPVQERVNGKLVTVAYVSYPWSAEDFDTAHPGVRQSGVYRGKPLTATPNPWVWCISFRRIANG